MRVEHLNPPELVQNPAFTQVIAVSGPYRAIYVGGQDAVDKVTRSTVGPGDVRAQTEQVFRNLKSALASAGAQLEHVVKWNVYIVTGQSAASAFEVFQREWGRKPNPPAATVLYVAGLANPDWLIEIDAIAVVPQ
ncbi:MAG TPA: RidA family protein [Myxococcaceae bacterium]|nr:RidA family protein [Myxococcaceae bacterium]